MKTFFSGLNQKFSWKGWAFFFILLVGVFLRTYQFHDWLRFNADQSRDAGIASSVVSGQEPLPLLGPKAGGTNFRLGAIFYYFQIGSAEIFGNAPDKMAYPDLLFSILAIPLLFFFLRKYFDVRTVLLLAAVFAVSAYAVKYSRFAWNPNSLPLWTMLCLYALHEIAITKDKRGTWWSILAGVALGVAVQLHTLTLILLPIVTLCVFGYLLYEKKKVWKALVIVFLTAMILNTGQLASEIQTGGANAKAFFNGVGTKEKKGSGVVMNVAKDTVCFVGANDYILSSYDASDTCEIKSATRGRIAIIFSLNGLIFFIGGVILAIRSFRREENVSKKYFLGIVGLYLGLLFLLLVPLANEISMRFFLASIFMPFIFFGLWFEYLSERFPKRGIWIALAIVILLVIANMISVGKTFSTYAAYLSSSASGMDNVLLKEVEQSSAFIVTHAGGAKTVSVEGDATYLFKALKSMQYFTGRDDIRLVQKGKKTDPNMPAFLIDNTKAKKKILENNQGISEYESFGRFTIFKLP